MKTAISIPDPIFSAADELAARLNLSRSELYVNAIRDFLKRHCRDQITKTLNKVYEKGSSKVDPVVSAMQVRSLSKDRW